jgi:hypothetical protein
VRFTSAEETDRFKTEFEKAFENNKPPPEEPPKE